MFDHDGESSTRRREGVLEAVAFAAERFLSVDDWEVVIGEVLRRLGHTAAVSRVHVFRNHAGPNGSLRFSHAFEWTAPGISAHDPDLQDVDYAEAGFTRWRRELALGRTVGGHVREFPASERGILQEQGIRSLLVAPILAGQEWWGFIGFDECEAEREWSSPEIDALKAAAGIVGAAIARRRSEVALGETEERYRRLVELSPDAIAVHRKGELVFANSRAARLLRTRDVDDLMGRSILEFVHPQSRPAVLQRLQRLREGYDVPAIEERFVALDGTPLDVEVTATPFVMEGESCVLVVVRDIAERKAGERALRAHNEYLEALHETALGVMNRLDPEEALVAIANRAAGLIGTKHAYAYVEAPEGEELEVRVGIGLFEDWVGFRLRRGEGVAGRVWESGETVAVEDYDTWEGRSSAFPRGLFHAAVGIPLKARGRVIGVLGLANEDPHVRFQPHEIRLLSRLAELASIALDNAKLYDEAQRELEERRRAEERLRFQADLLDSVDHAVIATGPDSRITYWNAAAEHLFGAPRREAVGRTFRDMIAVDDAVVASVNRAIDAGEPWSGDFEVGRFDGSSVIVFGRVSAIRGDGGEVQGAIGVCVDVTERRRAELALRDAFEREKEVSQRLMALDEMKNTFLEAVSHELRTPLSAILGFALTLEQHADSLPAERTSELVDRLAFNARKLDRLLSDLLDLDRLARGIVEPRRKPTDIGALVRQVVDGMELADERPVDVDAQPVVAMVDGPKIERIVENLVANAGRHTPDGTPIWVRVVEEDEGALIVVEDAGTGVPAELREAIFEPFRQGTPARPHSPGVGVGLSLVSKFAELHGGRAWVEDRPGGGASFRVWLPHDASLEMSLTPAPFDALRP
jgi:PAS domain S-box-containing protein